MKPYLSIIIPAFNEELRIAATLKSIHLYLTDWSKVSRQAFEILVVDDGSADATGEIVAQLNFAEVKYIRHDRNEGKGWAVRTGMLAAGGDYLLFTDADNSTRIDELPKFLPKLESGVEVVIGSRNLKGSRVVISQPLSRRLLGRVANWVIQVFAIWGIKDTQCGFKGFSQRAAQRLFSRQTIPRWGFDFEILALARRYHYKIVEVPVSWYNSKDSRVRPIASFFLTLAELIKIRLNLWRGIYD